MSRIDNLLRAYAIGYEHGREFALEHEPEADPGTAAASPRVALRAAPAHASRAPLAADAARSTAGDTSSERHSEPADRAPGADPGASWWDYGVWGDHEKCPDFYSYLGYSVAMQIALDLLNEHETTEEYRQELAQRVFTSLDRLAELQR